MDEIAEKFGRYRTLEQEKSDFDAPNGYVEIRREIEVLEDDKGFDEGNVYFVSVLQDKETKETESLQYVEATKHFVVETSEIRGGVEKSRAFVAKAEDFGKALYKYHQTLRGAFDYEDTSRGDKHTLHKNGNVCGIDDINKIGSKKFDKYVSSGATVLERQD